MGAAGSRPPSRPLRKYMPAYIAWRRTNSKAPFAGVVGNLVMANAFVALVYSRAWRSHRLLRRRGTPEAFSLQTDGVGTR